MAVKPIPDGHRTITPFLCIRNVNDALPFYTEAFGAVENFCLRFPDGKVAYADMKIGDSLIAMGEECPEWGAKSPLMLGGSPVTLMVFVADVDAAFAKAVEAGATVIRPLENQFYGDRSGTVSDPFGHQWTLAMRIEEVSHAEMYQRLVAMCMPAEAIA